MKQTIKNNNNNNNTFLELFLDDEYKNKQYLKKTRNIILNLENNTFRYYRKKT